MSFRWIKGLRGFFPQITVLSSRISDLGLVKGDIIAAINDVLVRSSVPCIDLHSQLISSSSSEFYSTFFQVPNLNKKTLWKTITQFSRSCTFTVFQLSIWRYVSGPLKTLPLFVESLVEDLQIELSRCFFFSQIPMRFELIPTENFSYWVVNE